MASDRMRRANQKTEYELSKAFLSGRSFKVKVKGVSHDYSEDLNQEPIFLSPKSKKVEQEGF